MQVITSSYHVTLTEPMLGSASGNPEIHREFIAGKAKDAVKTEEEVEALPPTPEQIEEKVEKSSTVFPRDKNGLFMWDYQLRGFFKEAIYAMIELGDAPASLSKWSYKKAVDTFLFVVPRRVYLLKPDVDTSKIKLNGSGYKNMPAGAVYMQADQTNERPLRATTMQGERIALARSEQLPEGTQVLFKVEILQPGPKTRAQDAQDEENEQKGKKPRKTSAVLTTDLIEACLNYGQRKGFGQWRGGGWGRFEWERLKA